MLYGKKISVDFEYSTYPPMEQDDLPGPISGPHWGQWVAQGAEQGVYIHLSPTLDNI